MNRPEYLEQHLPYPQPWEFVLDKIIGREKNLTFVEVGAYEPYIASNTAYMEIELNWKGICIEPHPIVFNKLKNSNRNCKKYNCAISDYNGFAEFVAGENHITMISGIRENYSEDHWNRLINESLEYKSNYQIINIECRTLSSILNENNIHTVDYLSIDTEGSEEKVLMGIDFNKFNIRVIGVENNNSNNSNIRNYLSKIGYEYVDKICSDEIYKKKLKNENSTT